MCQINQLSYVVTFHSKKSTTPHFLYQNARIVLTTKKCKKIQTKNKSIIITPSTKKKSNQSNLNQRNAYYKFISL